MHTVMSVSQSYITSKRHGHSGSPTYNSWIAMLQRCYYAKGKMYAYYGGRGITVCDRWRGKHGFINFLADMGIKKDGQTLDRINSDGNYEPSNCRWATRKEQALSRAPRGSRGISVSKSGKPRKPCPPRTPQPRCPSCGHCLGKRHEGAHARYEEQHRRAALRYQAKQLRKSRCTQCGAELKKYKVECNDCARKRRERIRERKGFSPWKPGGRGRPPFMQVSA